VSRTYADIARGEVRRLAIEADLRRTEDMDDTHTLNKHGTTDCPIERVRAHADPEDGVGLVCSACGALVGEVTP
jgi:hypothetical protein